mmetsp:Transcript_56560/g.157604  ORF Transcript_56560/g.157604 Transcript_56560/m.157604 type:complete len:676 (+) Transcript_56560:132-2159(+)
MAAASVPQFASLYVGDLHPDVTEAMLYEIFNSVGPVASIRVCRDSVSRRSLGYGYVNFHAVADAERTLDTLNYSSIKGKACRIMWSQRDPSLRKSGLGNVFVKNLDRNIDNKALYDTFSLFGNILSCKVAADTAGKSRGYGFVHYETEEAARQAIERVNGMQIGDKTVQVNGFVKRGDRDRPEVVNFTNVYVKNIPDNWDDEKLEAAFKDSGTVTSSCIMEDPKGRKFAFVNFADSDSAKKAIETMHMKDVRTEEQKQADKDAGVDETAAGPDGHPNHLLYVSRAQSKTERKLELRNKFGQSERPVAAPTRAQGVNLYVKNLDEDADDEALKSLFTSFGTITSAKAMVDEKGKCKGFGFVCFSSADEATKAVTEMHLKVVKGKPLYVGLAEKREARQERLRQRYSPGVMGGPGVPGMGGPGMMGGDAKGGKGGGKGGKGMGKPGMQQQGMGGMPPQMGMYGYAGMQGHMGMMGGPRPGMPGQQGMMMGGPQMMGKAPMMGPGGRPMMPQMMGPMGKGAPGGMFMGGKGMPAMPGMPTMPGGPGMMGPGMMGPGMMGPGMMRPQMPQQMGGQMPARPQQQQPPQQQPPQQAQPQPGQAGQPLTAAALAAAPPAVQKQMIGEKLYPAISRFQPELAGKITGMMLEMDNSELLMLLESEQQLKGKVDEAMRVLEGTRT